MFMTHSQLATLLLLAVMACDENPRSEVRTEKVRDGTGQTGMVSTKAGPEDTLEGKVPVPPSAAIQPVPDTELMATDAGVEGASIDARTANAPRDATANMDASASDAMFGVDATR